MTSSLLSVVGVSSVAGPHFHSFKFCHMAKLPVNYQVCVVLLCLGVWLSETKNIRFSVDDDLLSPYVHGHGPSHSHRHVRDCQPVAHGNVTHETWPASSHAGLPVAESSVFVTDVPGANGPRWVYGHMTVVHDPLRSVSVLEPGGPGGCGFNTRATVEETAEAAGCLYAQNAGFFSTGGGHCLGNVVSNSRLVQDSGGVQNAQFGIRKDGTLVFGYLSEEDVLDKVNPFIQLVSGVVWLLRNGQVYINQSLEAECGETQETGVFLHFVDVVSARTAVGHDENGRLILFHTDGQTNERGMNLWQVADFLKKNGVVNAINLDGGGSSTYIANGSLASYPSDHCHQDDRWRCPRRVSTVLCVHRRRCQSEDCSPHGACGDDGRCRCQEGCGAHGVCTAKGCVCDAGWRGENCSQACPLGFFGQACGQECRCRDMCPCDPVTGSCNASLHGERNYTFHRAGHCLAKQMFTTWRQEEESHKDEPPRLAERTWLMITVSLASLLLISLVAHLISGYRGSVPASRHSERHDYSYIPLNDINGDVPHGRVKGQGARLGKGALDPEDSEEEICSHPH